MITAIPQNNTHQGYWSHLEKLHFHTTGFRHLPLYDFFSKYLHLYHKQKPRSLMANLSPLFAFFLVLFRRCWISGAIKSNVFVVHWQCHRNISTESLGSTVIKTSYFSLCGRNVKFCIAEASISRRNSMIFNQSTGNHWAHERPWTWFVEDSRQLAVAALLFYFRCSSARWCWLYGYRHRTYPPTAHSHQPPCWPRPWHRQRQQPPQRTD